MHPVPDQTKLLLDEEGMRFLESIKGPVAPVVVIGPYRSGKSFLLNQLMNVSCDDGFGVGHTRSTETKGIWVFPRPLRRRMPDGREETLLFVDTEGFESTGKADVYDDRVFALSALMSSVLVYNLPEAIRESDLERLSFAVELARAFYGGDVAKSHATGVPPTPQIANGSDLLTQEPTVRPGSMVWVIQRDFLQGVDPNEALHEALAQVPNPSGDEGLAQLNRIRAGLHRLAAKSVAIGMPQPHLERTRLCELPDVDLTASYRASRERVRRAVVEGAEPKVVSGGALDGRGLAALLRRAVAALNDKEIPTAGSLVAYFNADLVRACREEFSNAAERLTLPTDSSALESALETAAESATRRLVSERFGEDDGLLEASLRDALRREARARRDANEAASARACAHALTSCERSLERQAQRRLPSSSRFAASFAACERGFNKTCVGPARDDHAERLEHAREREQKRFMEDYNSRLLGGLSALCVAGIVVFRFAMRSRIGELAAWAGFVFLQVYPATFVASSSSIYDTRGWKILVSGWEIVAGSPLLDLGRAGPPVLVVAAALAFTKRYWMPRVAAAVRRSARRSKRGGVVGGRDLDV